MITDSSSVAIRKKTQVRAFPYCCGCNISYWPMSASLDGPFVSLLLFSLANAARHPC
jgi:hypothetical protein